MKKDKRMKKNKWKTGGETLSKQKIFLSPTIVLTRSDQDQRNWQRLLYPPIVCDECLSQAQLPEHVDNCFHGRVVCDSDRGQVQNLA